MKMNCPDRFHRRFPLFSLSLKTSTKDDFLSYHSNDCLYQPINQTFIRLHQLSDNVSSDLTTVDNVPSRPFVAKLLIRYDEKPYRRRTGALRSRGPVQLSIKLVGRWSLTQCAWPRTIRCSASPKQALRRRCASDIAEEHSFKLATCMKCYRQLCSPSACEGRWSVLSLAVSPSGRQFAVL